jgi:esterase/lipase superfamily enzyme
LAIYTEDVVFYDPSKGAYRGRDEIDRIAGVLGATLPDFTYQLIAEPEELGDGGRVPWVSGRNCYCKLRCFQKDSWENVKIPKLKAGGTLAMGRFIRPIVRTVLRGVCPVLLAVGTSGAQCPSQLSGNVADLQSRLNATLGQLNASPPGSRDASHRGLQEKALRQLEELQCAKELSAPPEEVTRSPAVGTPLAAVPILFITDRASIPAPIGRHQYFSGERRVEGVSFGEETVRLPAENYQSGAVVPRGVTVTWEKDAHSGLTVGTPREESQDQFTAAIHAYAAGRRQGEPVRLMIFVHGFNVTFPEAAAAAARLSFGIRANILPVVVSWPSQGAMTKYWNDEENVEASVERLRPIFDLILSNRDVDEVEIVSHSMGTRLVARILSQLQLESAAIPKLSRVTFAAADLYEGEIQGLWPRIRALPTKGWVFYTSKNDFALLASSIVHDAPPIGDSRTRVFTLTSVDTVDASAVAPMLKGFGHSYVIDNPLLPVDLRHWIVQGLGPGQRGLVRGSRLPGIFWEISK